MHTGGANPAGGGFSLELGLLSAAAPYSVPMHSHHRRGKKLVVNPTTLDFPGKDGDMTSSSEPTAISLGDEQVVCQDGLVSVCRLLSQRSGQPSPLFRFIQLCCLAQAPHVMLGTFFSPGIIDVARQGDKLMGLVLLSTAMMNVVVVLILEDLRRAILPGGDLEALGAGSRCINAARYAQIEATMDKFHPGRAAAKAKVAVVVLMLCIVLVKQPEVGIQSPWQNRASALALMVWYAFANTTIAVWIISMKMATVLSSSAVEAVVSAIDAMDELDAGIW